MHFLNLKGNNLQSQASFANKNNLKKNLCILKDGASECASGDIEQVIVKIMFEI